MKVYITNGPRAGEVVEVDRWVRDFVLIDPVNPPSLALDPEPVESVHITTRRYVRGTVTREGGWMLQVRYGAEGIIYDPDLKAKEDKAEATRRAAQARMDALDPVERMAIEIEKTGAHDHLHCWSCDEDGEYPCCRALEDARMTIEARSKTGI